MHARTLSLARTEGMQAGLLSIYTYMQAPYTGICITILLCVAVMQWISLEWPTCAVNEVAMATLSRKVRTCV